MTDFKDRYILGEGYPVSFWNGVGLCKSLPEETDNYVKLKWYMSLIGQPSPRYRLVLERVK